MNLKFIVTIFDWIALTVGWLINLSFAPVLGFAIIWSYIEAKPLQYNNRPTNITEKISVILFGGIIVSALVLGNWLCYKKTWRCLEQNELFASCVWSLLPIVFNPWFIVDWLFYFIH